MKPRDMQDPRPTSGSGVDILIHYLDLPTAETKPRHTAIVGRIHEIADSSTEQADAARRELGHTGEYEDCPACGPDEDGDITWCRAEPIEATLLGVNPGIQRKAAIAEICEEMGCGPEYWHGRDRDAQIEDLLSQGVYAVLSPAWLCLTIPEAEAFLKAKADEASILGGFWLDAPQNALGATGWDLLRGEPLAKLKTHKLTKEENV